MANPKQQQDPKQPDAKAEAPAPVEPPQFLVTMPPGAPVAGVGFVDVGKIFTAPPGYIPSLTFYAVNPAAVESLAQAFKARAALLEKRLGRAQSRAKRGGSADDVEALLTQLEELEVEAAKRSRIVGAEAAQPVVRPGLTMEQLAELSRQADADSSGIVAKAAAAKEQRDINGPPVDAGGNRNL